LSRENSAGKLLAEWTAMRRVRKFPPCTRVPELAAALKLRQFAGFDGDDIVQCKVAAWPNEDGLTVVLSPDDSATGDELAAAFEQVANHYYVELVTKRVASRRTPIRWVQHWPARQGAPQPFDEDHFENVQLQPHDARLELACRQLIDQGLALKGLSAAVPPENADSRTSLQPEDPRRP
jgi:hypothetical protein